MYLVRKFKFFSRFKYLLHLLFSYFFKYQSWHISPIDSREYCLDTVDYINAKINYSDCIVEIGCGLGETINLINCEHRFGYDTSHEVISAANFFNLFSKISFNIGSFNSVKNKKIQYLVALNFLHDFNEDTVRSWFHEINESNVISFILVDEVADEEYQHNHNFDSFLPKNFIFFEAIGKVYRYNRRLKVYKNVDII